MFRFSFSLLVLLVLATPAFTAPTKEALPRHYLDFSLGGIASSNGPAGVKEVAAPGDEHHKRHVGLRFELQSISTGNVLAADKRNSEEAKELPHLERYNLAVTSTALGTTRFGRDGTGPVTPPPGFARSTDTYEGCHVLVSIPDDMVHDLQTGGITNGQISYYISKAMRVTDHKTGFQYQLFPDDSPSPTSVHDIILNFVYEPTASA